MSTPRPLAAASAILVALAAAGAARGAEARIPIAGPVTLTVPGTYFLTRDISSGSSPNAIVVATTATIDLNGHTVTGGNAGAVPILVQSFAQATVVNGIVQAGATGIEAQGASSLPRLTVRHVTFVAQSVGISTTDADAVIVEDCAFSAQATAIDLGATVAATQVRIARNTMRTTNGIRTTGDILRGTIESNHLNVAAGGTGITVSGRGLDVLRNVVESGVNGIVILGAGNQVERNSIIHATGAGLDVRGDNNTVARNAVTACQGAGVLVESQGNVIDSNLVNANQGAGIAFALPGATQNVYKSNTLRGNGGGAVTGMTGNTDGGGNL